MQMTFDPKTNETTPGLPAMTFDLDALKSTTFAGLPSWATPYLKSWLGSYGGGAMQGAADSVAAMNNAPKFINQQRVLANRQYNRGIGASTSRAVGDAVSQAMGRGIGNSSMLGDIMERLGGELASGAQGAHNASNLWAAGANQTALKDRLGANLSMAAMMNDLINASKYSTSTNPMNPAALNLGLSPT